MRALLALSRAIDRLNETIGTTAAWFTLAAVLLSAGNAVSRKAFNMASNALLELQWYLFGAVFLLCAAYTLKHAEHVRVDLIYGAASRRTQHWIDLVGHIIVLMPFVVWMTYYLTPYTIHSFMIGERSLNVGGLVLWPAKALLLAGFALLGLQGISEIIKKAALLRGDIDDDAPGHVAKAPLETLEKEPRA